MGASNKSIRSFEEQWAEAFESAEMAPSDQLWVSLDGALANMEAHKYRRGIFFYRLLAAGFYCHSGWIRYNTIIKG